MVDAELAWIAGLSFPALFGITAYLLYSYAVPTTPIAMKVTVFACWFLGFAGTLLLPIDMGYALFEGANDALQGVWLFLFWSTFVAAWVITPVMMEYWAAGDFTPKARLRTSIRVNVKFYLVLLIVAAVVILVVLILERFAFSSVASLLIAASDAYGLLLIIALLGYGFVELPRALWLRSFPARKLRDIHFRAALVDEGLYAQQVELVETAADVAAACAFVRSNLAHNAHLVSCAAVLEAETPQDVQEVHRPGGASASAAASARAGPEPDVVASLREADDEARESMLASLRHKLRRRSLARERARNRWAQIVRSAAVLDIVVSGAVPDTRAPPNASLRDRLRAALLGLWWRYRVHADARVSRAAACVAAVMSVVLLWCECTIALPAKLSPWGAAVEGASSGTGVFFAAGIPLVYLSICTYRSFFRVRLPMVLTIGIFPDKHTDAYSLLLSACYLSRLQFALCYNFLLILQIGPDGAAGVSGSAWLDHAFSFSAVVGRMDVVPFLGNTFNRLFPALSLVVFSLTLFNVCGRVFRWLGVEELEPYSPDNEEHQERVDRGRRIVTRARNRELGTPTPTAILRADTAAAALEDYVRPEKTRAAQGRTAPARDYAARLYEPPAQELSVRPGSHEARRGDLFSSL